MSRNTELRERGRLGDVGVVAKEVVREPVREAVAEAFAEEAARRERSSGGSRRRPRRVAVAVLALLGVAAASYAVMRWRSGGRAGHGRDSGTRRHGSATVESRPTDPDRPDADRPTGEPGRPGPDADGGERAEDEEGEAEASSS